MFSASNVWLIGDPSDAFASLAVAIEEAGGQPHRLNPTESARWRARVRAGEYEGSLPNLLIVDARLAYGHPDRHLEELLATPPWMFLPLVVLAHRPDAQACARAYAEGAAAWITLPRDPEALGAHLEHIARYWIKTAVLPEITLPL
jgi:DNA-binding NtrC family response regulator